jgi:hypothetical protein
MPLKSPCLMRLLPRTSWKRNEREWVQKYIMPYSPWLGVGLVCALELESVVTVSFLKIMSLFEIGRPAFPLGCRQALAVDGYNDTMLRSHVCYFFRLQPFIHQLDSSDMQLLPGDSH